jgi:hypothetical protein
MTGALNSSKCSLCKNYYFNKAENTWKPLAGYLVR